MNHLTEILRTNPGVSDYKINIHQKESYELFFVKGLLETVRCTDNRDTEVTMYVDHDNFKGEASFFVYPSTTETELRNKVEEAVSKARLIRNQTYTIPCPDASDAQPEVFSIDSNFNDYEISELAARIARLVFDSNTVENGSLNSVEIFLNRHTDTLVNSRGVNKTQTRWDAMVEAIPTYNGEQESVELYEQYNFSSLDEASLTREISEKMAEVKARYEAVKPDFPISCPVMLHAQEISDLVRNIAYDLNYASIYSHSNLFSKGDSIQSAPTGDLLGITMTGSIPGSVRSSAFDSDGLPLGSIRIVEGGKAINYFGANRYGQYLGEPPTGNLGCIMVDPGHTDLSDVCGDTWLEVLSMSGLQVDFYSDYIGGEIRLAYYHHQGKQIPLTGISISGKLSMVLNNIRFSGDCCVMGSYSGPRTVLISDMAVF